MGDQYIVVTISIYPDGNLYTAEALELGVGSFGDTFEEADANIKEALEVYLDGIAENGTKDRVFREKGIIVYQDEPETHENARYQRVPVPVAG